MFISEEDKAELKVIVEISKSIYDNYDRLKQLEIDGKTESDEYKEALSMLNSSLFLEQSLYDKLFAKCGNDPYKLIRYLEEVSVPVMAWDVDMDMYYARNNDRENLIKRRIALRIFDRMNNSGKRSPVASVIINAFNQSTEVMTRLIPVSVSVRNDFVNTILVFLNQVLEYETNLEIRFNLIRLKANISFLYKFVENDFLDNNFNVNSELFWTSKIAAIAQNVNFKFIDIYKQYYASRISNPIAELSEMSKEDLEDSEKRYEALVNQILLRVALVFGGDYMKEKLNDVKKTGEDTAYFMIEEALDMYDADREIPKIVSFTDKL